MVQISPKTKSSVERVLIYCILTLATGIFLFPIFWIALSSVKPTVDIFSIPPTVMVRNPSLRHYYDVLVGKLGFYRYIENSLIVALSTMAITMSLGSLAAYSFARARYKFRGSLHIYLFILIARMFPAIALVIPIYLLMSDLGLLNNLWALIITYSAFGLPFVTWMMKGFFQGLPTEIEEAALIDGCSRIGAFIRVALPLSAPGLAATAIFVFIGSWNEFLFALMLASAPESRTIPVAIAGLAGVRVWEPMWGPLFAGSIVYIIPVLIFTVLVQKHIIRGLTVGAIKR